MRSKQVPDAFYFPQSFQAGCLISFVSVMYMGIMCFKFLMQLKTNMQKQYGNVYDIMYNFFRTGNQKTRELMKISLDSRIIEPFETKLNNIRVMLEDITFALQVGFFCAVVLGLLVFFFSLMNLILDYKTRILEARKGIFRDFHVDKLEVIEGSSFPGYVISNSIAAFFIVVAFMTVIISLIVWPLFWYFLWSIKFTLLSIMIPVMIKDAMEGYVVDYVYEQYYAKRRGVAGFLDIFYFFLSILEGFGAALNRFKNGLQAFLICQARINVPCLPEWLLRYSYMDEFHRSYMGFIYLQHAHNNPTLIFMAQTLINTVNERKQKRYNKIIEMQKNEASQEDINEMIEKSLKIHKQTNNQ